MEKKNLDWANLGFGYMQTDYLEGMAGGLPLCKACFDGNYPMEIPDYTNAEFADIVKC